MAKFRFKLEALEKVRKTKEQEALRGLSSAQTAYHAATSHKSNLIGVLEQALAHREGICDSPVTSHEIALATDHITGTKQRIIQADQAILRARRGVEKALRIYLVARRQMRMMEVLREKAFEEFKRAQAKKQQRELDDLYVMRARMRSPGIEGGAA